MYDLVKKLSIKNNKTKICWQLVFGLTLLIPFLYHTLIFTNITRLNPEDMEYNKGVDAILREQIGSFWSENYIMIQGQYRDVVYHGLLSCDSDGNPYVMALSASEEVGGQIHALPKHGSGESGKPIYISGGLREMDPVTREYFDKYLEKMEWPEGETKPYPVYFILDRYGSAPVFSWVVGAIGALIFFHGIYLLWACFSGFFAKRFIRAVDLSRYSEKEVEQDFINACKEGLYYNNFVTGAVFTYMRVGDLNPVIIANKKITWLYSRERNIETMDLLATLTALFYILGYVLVFFAYPFRSFFKPVDITIYVDEEKKYYRSRFINTKIYLGVLYDYYSKTCPWVKLGYSEALKKAYKEHI